MQKKQFEQFSDFTYVLDLVLHGQICQHMHEHIDVYQWLEEHNAVQHVYDTFSSYEMWYGLVTRVVKQDVNSTMNDYASIDVSRDIYEVLRAIEQSLYWKLYALLSYKVVTWAIRAINETFPQDVLTRINSNSEHFKQVLIDHTTRAIMDVHAQRAIGEILSVYER